MAGAANAAQYERNLVQLLGTIRRSLFHLNPLLPIIMGVQVGEAAGQGGNGSVQRRSSCMKALRGRL